MRVVNIRAKEYEKVEQETRNKGISIELSPYDKPLGIEARFDDETGVLHIEFKYLDKEESVSKRLNEKLNMKVGKHSGKILGFEVNVIKYDIKEVVLKIAKEVDQLIPYLQKYNQRANYQFIKNALDTSSDRFTELAHP